MCIQLDSQNWLYHYYRATPLSLTDKVEDCLSDLRACLDLTAENEHYSLIHWLYTSYCELGRYKEAQECLFLIKDDVVPPQMNYGYSMCVKLYKGLVKPEEFIDEEKWPRSFSQGKKSPVGREYYALRSLLVLDGPWQ